MRFPLLPLVLASVVLPQTNGFVHPSAIASGSNGRAVSCRGASEMRRHGGSCAERRPGGLTMRKEMTDGELEGVKLDTSTLSGEEKKRVEGLRDMQAKFMEIDAKKYELRAATREAREAQEDMALDKAPVVDAPAVDDGLTVEERKRAAMLASIEASLDEVTEIQKKLGIRVEDDDDEEKDVDVKDTAWMGQAGLDVRDPNDGARNWADLATRKWLAVGDVAALTAFAYVGRASHGMGEIDLWVLVTASPFLIGWLAVSPLLGAYTNSATASVENAARSLVPAWAVSMPVAIGLRALSKGGEVPPVPFAVTSMIFTFVSLLAWRGLYTAFNPTGTGDKEGGILDGFRMITNLLRRW